MFTLIWKRKCDIARIDLSEVQTKTVVQYIF